MQRHWMHRCCVTTQHLDTCDPDVEDWTLIPLVHVTGVTQLWHKCVQVSHFACQTCSRSNTPVKSENIILATYATTCMYSANLPRNLVRLPGWSTIIIFVISSTVFAGRRIPRLLEGARRQSATFQSFKQEFISSPEWKHFWEKACCPGMSCFLKSHISHLISLLFFPDSHQTAFCDCLFRTIHLMMTMGHLNESSLPLSSSWNWGSVTGPISLEGDKSKVVERNSGHAPGVR